MVLEKSISFEVGKMPAKDVIGIAEMKYQGKLTIENGEDVIDPKAKIHTGDKVVIAIAIENYSGKGLHYSLTFFDNETEVPTVASIFGNLWLDAKDRVDHQIAIPCGAPGTHIIMARIALAQ